ncbi:unnamed protein product [Nezara viridula]|uniref:Uncharacterized protein n=1 Tax=Nezara viridula TaxID=85310 RepID=A0A9P0HUN9_NEZVI|nr:unnamed protein product [Nezara viridula]
MMVLKFIIEGRVSGSGHIENILNIKIVINYFICNKVA